MNITRRKFVARSALGLIGNAALSQTPVARGAEQGPKAISR